MAELPKLDVVIGNNFGHLPMFIGAEKGFFKKHGVDAKMLVVDTGTDMVNAMHDGRAQIGDMSTTTYLKAVHAGEPFKVIGLIMNDATSDNCDDPLAIVTKKGRGIEAGKLSDLKGKKIGLARGQTSDEYFKMVLRRAKMKYEELTIENIWSQFGLAPALAEGKVDAVVSWEPYVTQVLTQVPDSYLVIRGGQHMSYVMVATAHGPTIESKPAVVKSIAAGLAQSSHFTRNNRDEAVEIFAKWVPGTDVAIGKKAVKHISFDPRLSPNVMRAFENAEDEVLMNTLQGRSPARRAQPVPAAVHGRGREGAPGIFRGFAEAEVVDAPHAAVPREAGHRRRRRLSSWTSHAPVSAAPRATSRARSEREATTIPPSSRRRSPARCRSSAPRRRWPGTRWRRSSPRAGRGGRA